MKELTNFKIGLKLTLIKISHWVQLSFISVKNFLAPVPESIIGIVNPEEFYRIFLLALSSGGGFWGFADYIHVHLKDFVTDSNIIVGVDSILGYINEKNLPMTVFAAVFILDYLRRKYKHGESL